MRLAQPASRGALTRNLLSEIATCENEFRALSLEPALYFEDEQAYWVAQLSALYAQRDSLEQDRETPPELAPVKKAA